MVRSTLLAGALLLAGLSAASAASTCTYVAGVCIPNAVLVDPATGLPYAAGGGAGSSGSVTAPGTAGTQAQAVQGVPGGVPQTTAPTPVTITQTLVTLAAGTSAQLIGANAARKSLRWMVTGTNPMTVAPGASAAVVGSGMNYSGGAGAGQQGGSESFEGTSVPTNAFQAISAGGTTVTVWEGQ